MHVVGGSGLGIAALLLHLGGCSPAPMPVSQAPNDPSSPTAPEGVSPMLPASVPSPPATAPAAGGHEHKLVPKK